MALAERSGCEIVLPIDEVVAMKLEENAEFWICPVDKVPADAMILDAGPESLANLKRRLAGVRTVLWNGPLGAFETKPFGEGTLALAREVARLTREGRLISVAGGGDTVRALNDAGVAADITYVSTAGRRLPGMAWRPRPAGGPGARPKRRPRSGLEPRESGRYPHLSFRESGNIVTSQSGVICDTGRWIARSTGNDMEVGTRTPWPATSSSPRRFSRPTSPSSARRCAPSIRRAATGSMSTSWTGISCPISPSAPTW